MKIKYTPGGPVKAAPRTWEVWLADIPSLPGKTKRCPVAVGKHASAGWTVYEIVPLSGMDGRDAVITNLSKAGQDRPCAVHIIKPLTVQQAAFIQKMGVLAEADISKCISGSRL